MKPDAYGQTDFKDFADFAHSYRFEKTGDFNFAFDCIDRMAQSEPDKTAMVWCDDKGNHMTYTFAQISAYSDAAARFFASAGISQGDPVMLVLKRRTQFWFAVLGLMKLGAVAIPTTHLLVEEDIVYRNNAASVAAILTTDDENIMDAVDGSLPQSPTVRRRLKLGGERPGWLSFDAGLHTFMEGEALPRVTRNEDMMLLYFTSGTTGMPKMVAHNYVYPLAHIGTARHWHALHPGSLHLTAADTGWAKAAWGKLYGQWLCGAAIFVYDHERFDVHRLLTVMSRHKVTSFCAPPTIFRVLANADLHAYDLSALEHLTSAGEPLSETVFRQIQTKTGLSIHEAYGQTETTPLVMTSRYTEPRPGSIGKPNPAYDLLFLDENGQEVPCGAEGELCVRARRGDLGLFMGYYRDDAMSDYVWRGGVYHTGDMAYQDEDGYVWFIGRADDIIKSAGYRIGPFEVESVLIKHPAVLECAVTAAPDPMRGQVVKASVILAEGYEASEKLKRALRAHVRSLTSAYKVPRIVEFVETFPKTISGKVQRAAMRKNG
ncbi:MAG: AMP-binding protein [Clostridiales Family XIII bacterium]|jgi:acetyl-CoA synthetase|nr:AMP-binding protein [Clostridiales Family XIII bacterium]